MYSPDTSPYVWGLTSSRRREDLRWANTPAWIEWERWHKSPPADTPAPHPRTHTCPKSVRGHIWMCNQDKWMLVSARAYPVSVCVTLHVLCCPLQKPKARCRWRWSGSWKTPFEANQPVCRLFSGTNGHKNKHKAQSGCTRHKPPLPVERSRRQQKESFQSRWPDSLGRHRSGLRVLVLVSNSIFYGFILFEVLFELNRICRQN